jgi:hypothetical protein
MSVLFYAIPFLYAGSFIIFPIITFDIDYWQSMIILFWIPSAILSAMHWKWMARFKLWTPFLLTWMSLNIVSIIVEMTSLYWGIWHFNNNIHKMLYALNGKNPLTYPFGAPIEEFLFYFGATPFCFMVYIYYFRLIKKNKETLRPKGDLYSFLAHLAWIAIGLPFVPFLKYIAAKIKDQKVVSWAAVCLTTCVFYSVMVIVERYSVAKMHWVYNYSKVIVSLGYYKIPIEEYILYYLLGPMFVVFFFHFLELRPRIILQKRSELGN